MKVTQLTFGIQVDFTKENMHTDYCYDSSSSM